MTTAYRTKVPFDPREEYDNLGTMVCFHRRYQLGDKGHGYTPDSLTELMRRGKIIYLPLYLYDHSGLAMSWNDGYPFNDPWDAGCVGIIFVHYDTVRKEFGCDEITDDVRNRVLDTLRAEVEEYDDYLRGTVEEYDVEEEEFEMRIENELPVQLPLLPGFPVTWEGQEKRPCGNVL